MKENIAAIVTPIVLILSSVLSPSNGLEEGSNKNSYEILMIAAIASFAGIALFLIGKGMKSPKMKVQKIKEFDFRTSDSIKNL